MRDEKDIPDISPLIYASHKESRYGKFQLNDERLEEYLRDNVLGKTDRFGFIIAELQGEPVGYLGCVANRLLYCDEIISSCMAFYVVADYRKALLDGRIAIKLLNAYRLWAINRRAVEIQIHVTSGIDIIGTDKFLRRVGFRQSGGNYALALPKKGT